jgi:flagellar FliL protein
MAKDDQAGTEAPEGGNKKMLFIIIGAAVAVLVVLVVVFMMMGKGDKKESKEGEGAKTEAAAGGSQAGAPAGGAEGGAAGAATIFALEPFIVNIYDGQELRYLKVKVEMEMASPAVKPELDGRLAAMRDAILVVLTSKTLQDIQDIQGKNQLREEILTAVSKIVAQGKVIKIYFTDFVIQ